MNSGIYKIINLITNDFYLGSSIDLEKRFRSHRQFLKQDKHVNIILTRAWKKYGENAFIFHVVEYCKPDDCLAIEQFYLDSLKCAYNIAKNSSSPMKDRKHSAETIAKLNGRQSWNKGIARTENEKALMSRMRKIAHTKMSPEALAQWKERLSKNTPKTWLGKNISEESKAKISSFWKNKNSYYIECLQNGKKYLTQLEAAKDLKVKQGHISEQLAGNRASASGFTFRKVAKNV
jgi:group I intron endonuclease